MEYLKDKHDEAILLIHEDSLLLVMLLVVLDNISVFFPQPLSALADRHVRIIEICYEGDEWE